MLSEDQYADSAKYEARLYINRKFKTNPQSKFKWIFEHFPQKENLRVLELGCGTGLFWLANRNEIPPGWQIILSDYSAGMLEVTRKTLSNLRQKFEYRVVNAEDIDSPDKEFDIILANNMLYHLDNRSKALADIYRVLKDDGVFVASTMGKMDMWELNLLLKDFLAKQNREYSSGEFAFSLENGQAQLQPFFPNVTLYRFEDRLKIDEAQAIINYYLSFNNMREGLVVLKTEEVEPFRDYLNKILGERKIIEVTKDSGMFLCRR
ncbi:MAG: class I SAM-dependent methyltransferase [Candidatus Margulisbacteria bacterium]|nr:class I SAM-dependent methyltransferase [Candidatus Margulisiibacteriota bacterium]